MSARPATTDRYMPPGSQRRTSSATCPPIELQEFVITNGITDRNLKVFPSEKSMSMYKEHRRLSSCHADFPRAKKAQNSSIGLPLMVTKRSISFGIRDTSYLRFFECVPSPDAKDRLYNKVDNRHIGEVLRRKFVGYCRYRLQIKGVETVIIQHTRLPLVDLKIHNDRFRFVKAINPLLNPDRFLYELYLLAPDQGSLLDHMDSSMKVQRDNPLLGGRFHNIFQFKWHPSDRTKYTSPHKCGTFEFHRSWEMFSRTKKCSVFSMYTYAVGKQDQSSAVEFRSLILVAVALILQSFEDDLHAARTAKTSSSSSTVMSPHMH